MAECWRVHYSTIMPHSALGYMLLASIAGITKASHIPGCEQEQNSLVAPLQTIGQARSFRTAALQWRNLSHDSIK